MQHIDDEGENPRPIPLGGVSEQRVTRLRPIFMSIGVEDPRRLVGIGASILSVASGFISVSQYERAGEYWWNKNSAEEILSAVEIINRASLPLVVSSVPSGNPLKLFTMAHPLGQPTRFLMTDGRKHPAIPDEQDRLFLWNVAPCLPEEFKRQGWRVQELGPPDLFLATRRLP